jgi:hypothetical protein
VPAEKPELAQAAATTNAAMAGFIVNPGFILGSFSMGKPWPACNVIRQLRFENGGEAGGFAPFVKMD